MTRTHLDTNGLSEAKQRLLAKYLREGPGYSSPKLNAIGRRSPGTTVPLSVAQEQLWLREQGIPGISPLYNECVRLRMMGQLDVVALERSFNEIIRRHEIWRTTFETVAGVPVQIIHPPMPLQLPIIDLSEFPGPEKEAEAVRRISEDVGTPFHLQKGPLLRPTLVKMDDTEHHLFLVAHQTVLDGMSAYQIFPSELAVLYKAFSADKPSPLPELPFQYADFACWQREWLKGEAVKQVGYWRKQLEGKLPVLEWPRDEPRSARRTFRGIIRPFAFSKQLSEEIRELSHRENTTLFVTLLAGFAALLQRYTNQEDIILNTLSPSGRKRTEVLGLLGYFLNPVALRLNFKSDPTYRDLLVQARTVMSEAISNDDVPIELLAGELKPGVDSSRYPFMRVAVSLQPPMPNLDLPWSVTSMDVDSGGSPWDLYLAFIDRPWGMIGRCQFNPDLFDPQMITGLLQDLQTLLERLVATPLQHLSEVNVILRAVHQTEEEDNVQTGAN